MRGRLEASFLGDYLSAPPIKYEKLFSSGQLALSRVRTVRPALVTPVPIQRYTLYTLYTIPLPLPFRLAARCLSAATITVYL